MEPAAGLVKLNKYGYLHLATHELVAGGLAGGSAGGSGLRTSYAPSALGVEHKPWLSNALPRASADALPRRFRDGLPLAPGVIEGVAAVQDVAPPTASGELPMEPAAPYTAPRRTQRTYDVPQAGGCLCGAIRFAVNAAKEPRLVVACHCQYCQRSSGAPFLAWATLDSVDYTLLQGTPAEYVQSGGVRRFCGACGTPLSFQRSDLPDELDVHLHSFDTPTLWQCEMNIWTEHQRAPLNLAALPAWRQDPARLLRRGAQET